MEKTVSHNVVLPCTSPTPVFDYGKKHCVQHLIPFAHSQGPIPTKLRRLKQCILEGMISAQHRIAQKVGAEGWAGGINYGWLVKLSRVKRSWCNGICRFAVLRWALNQDDDVWLSLRGTRHNQPCQLCGHPTDIFPMGFWHSPICESCIRNHIITPASLYADSPAGEKNPIECQPVICPNR